MWRRALLCVLLAAGTVRAAVVTGSAADCPAVRSALLEKGVAESALSAAGAVGEVCQNASCCSQPWELGIRDLLHRNFRKHVLDSTDQVKNLLHHQVIAVQDVILKAVHLANQSTIQRYNDKDNPEDNEDNPASDSIVQHAISTLFNSFMRYFQSELSDPELEDAITVFFDDLFVVKYRDWGELNSTLETCLREKRDELDPFRDVPFRMKEQLLSTFGLAKFYLQSLYGGLEVLTTTTQFEYSKSCYEALTRLSYCPLCRGLTEVRPCSGFCFNAMRGCMAPLSTLSEYWQSYVDVLRKLATSLQTSNNVETYLFKMYLNISEAMTNVWRLREELERKVAEICGGVTSTTEPTRRRRELEMRYRSSGDLGGALPRLPQREQQVDFESAEEPQLNKLLRAFNSDVDQHKLLFRDLSTETCNDGVYDGGPEECWNGETVGDYRKPLAGVGLDSQVYNPEVVVPRTRDPVLMQKADLLDQIKQGSNDKLASKPSIDSYRGGDYDDFYDGPSGSGYGISEYADDYDYASISGSGDYPDDDYSDYSDDRDNEVTLPTSVHEEEDVDLEIPGETDVVLPETKVDPEPPIIAQPPASTTPKPSGAAAVAACWTLLAATLVAAAPL